MMSSAGDRAALSTAPDPPDPPDPDFGSEGRKPLIALALARAIVAVVFCGFAGTALLFVLESGKSAGEIVLAIACLFGLLGLQYFYFGWPSTNPHSRLAYAVLLAQACLAYLPLFVFDQSWVSLPSFLAGSVLLVFPPPMAWPVFLTIVASSSFVQSAISDSTLDAVYIAVNTAAAGLFVFGLTRLARLVTTLHAARDELAKTAVAHERLRFARDLHDLLGLSLSAIAPKGELTLRLLLRNPSRAKQELSEILEISRRALADVRSIARLYREISLDRETKNIASMLAASNVGLRMELDLRKLPPHMRTSLAAVLREGVADVLRRRSVAHCEIVLGRRGDSITIDIVNDLVDGGGAEPASGGFDNLSTTVSRMDGELTVRVDDDGRLCVHVILPVTAQPSEGPTGAGDEPRNSIPHVATMVASGLVIAVFCGLFLQALLRMLYVPLEFWQTALSTAYLLAALVLQLGYFSRPGTRLRSRTSYLLLGLQALLVYLPLVQFQETWTGLPGFLAGSALLVLPPALGWSVFFGVVATVAWAQVALGAILPTDIGFNILLTVNSGLIVYGLTWMARTVRQLRAARQELAKVALAETRLRFARDLHDLLGLSLSAITLKCELAHRLVLVEPARARAELTEVLDISRQALTDVRSVAGGYHEMSLDEECRTAESLLTTAEINVRMNVDYGDLPPAISTVLATVLREGVTNVLRHSKAECCEITIGTDEEGAHLQIVNNGVQSPKDSDQWGSGIRNLCERVTALGGLVTAGLHDKDRFELRALIPVPSTAPATTA